MMCLQSELLSTHKVLCGKLLLCNFFSPFRLIPITLKNSELKLKPSMASQIRRIKWCLPE